MSLPHFQYALNDEYHVGAARVVFVEAERNLVLQRPWQHPFANRLPHALAHDHSVLADQVDAADMAVEIDGCKAS